MQTLRLPILLFFLCGLAIPAVGQQDSEWTWKDRDDVERTRAELDEILAEHKKFVASPTSKKDLIRLILSWRNEMKKLIALLALVFLLSGCTFLKKTGAFVCEREEQISAGINQGGEMLSGVIGPVATVGAWTITTVLDAACDAFAVLVSAPADLGDDAMKLSPWGGSNEEKKSDPPGK